MFGDRIKTDQWKDLADYNSRVHKGIMHTPEYAAKMAVLQEQFDREMAASRRPHPVADDGLPHCNQWGEYVVLEYVAPTTETRPPRPTFPPGSMPTLEDGTPAL